jgi:phenylacetate-CoA ligase
MKLTISKKNIWENMPGSAKKIAGYMLRIIPPEYLVGKNYRRMLEFLSSSQWWSKDEQYAYQLTETKRILSLAYDKSKFYKNVFNSIDFKPDDLKCLEDLKELPVIDKQIVIDNLEDMLTVSLDSGGIDYTTTGGTSGSPLRFYTTTKRSELELAYLNSGWGRVGYKLGDTMAVLRGRTVSKNRNGIYHEEDMLLRQNYFSSFHLDDKNIKTYLDYIRTLGPCYLHVYPSSVSALARYIARNECGPINNVKAIIAESEIVYPEQRDMVENAIGCRLFSSYGHTEKLICAAECEENTDYHVWPTYGYLELLDENGKEIKESGKIGELTGTGFINTVMPFIRYKTGDFAEYVSEQCDECGRKHILIRNIRGHRTQEVLITKSGLAISWTAINVHDNTFDEVVRFQFVQERPGHTTLNIVPSDKFNDSSHIKIKNNLYKKLTDQIEIDIRLVDKIDTTSSGKGVYVVQKISNERI